MRRMGRTGRAALAAALLLAAVVWSAMAQAQIRFLPASEYDHVNIRAPQAIVSQVNALSQKNVFERLANFKANDRYRKAGRPIGRLKIMVRDESGRTGAAMCTASIVSPEYLLTNYHCLPGEIGLTLLGAKVEFDYLDSNDTAAVRAYEVDLRPVESNDGLDYSILRVKGNPAAEFGTITFASQPVDLRESVFIIGYPEGQPETLSRKDCRVSAVKTQEFVHSCDTLPGSSGSPVFSDNTFRMIGLHFAGGADGNFAKDAQTLRQHSRILESVVVLEAPPKPSGTPAAVSNLTVALDSQPQGAAVFLDKTLLGVTPLSFTMAPKGSYAFEMRKSGYQDAALTIEGRPGNVQRMVALKAAAPAAAAAPKVGGDDWLGRAMANGKFDPATAQARQALNFWAQMDQGGAGAAPAGTDKSPAAEQERKADDFWKTFGAPASK